MEIKIEVEKEKSKEGPEEWEVCQAVDTLMRAEEIKQDAKLMSLVKEKMDVKKKAIDSLSKLRTVAAKKIKEYDDESLMTEEDKATIQDENKFKKNIKEMGLKMPEEK